VSGRTPQYSPRRRGRPSVRSVSKSQPFWRVPGQAPSARHGRKRSISRSFAMIRAPWLLLAMQKVVGSNPISRSRKSPAIAGFFRPRRRVPRPRVAAFSRSGEVHLRLVRTPAGANQSWTRDPANDEYFTGDETSGATFWKTATNTSPRTSSGSPKEVSEVDDPSPVGAASEQLSDKRPFDLVGDQPAGGRADVSERAWPDAHSAGNRSARPSRLASGRGLEPASDEDEL
jgi:hypothetical protein